MAVDRCICHDVTFAELKRLAENGVRDLDELSKRTGCGTGCGMCIPYIRVMLATGITDLPVLTSQQADSIIASNSEQQP
ncbi:MAG: (2Fe-2S)-binding protein [Phycisphaeraceae bacterium]|nr:(2Fe-2S)-binding protein [Phycisphaeraceae bacterium]